MPSTSIRVALILLVIYGLAVSAAPGLLLNVSGPGVADGVDKLKFVVRVTNAGDKTLKLLNAPNGPLSSFPTDNFVITHENGSSPAFVGMMVGYVPEDVIELDLASSFTVLTPGESVEVPHDLSEAYDFTESGDGEYTFEPNNLFYYVGSTCLSATPIPIYAVAGAHRATVSGTFMVSSRSYPQSEQVPLSDTLVVSDQSVPRFINCPQQHAILVRRAAQEALRLATNARTSLASRVVPAKYTTWFGIYAPTRHATASQVFGNVVNRPPTGLTYDCTWCTNRDWYGVVHPNTHPSTIFLCPQFWRFDDKGKAAAVVHESAHLGGAVFRAEQYGEAQCRQLAQTHPDVAVHNADNIKYFAI